MSNVYEVAIEIDSDCFSLPVNVDGNIISLHPSIDGILDISKLPIELNELGELVKTSGVNDGVQYVQKINPNDESIKLRIKYLIQHKKDLVKHYQ